MYYSGGRTNRGGSTNRGSTVTLSDISKTERVRGKGHFSDPHKMAKIRGPLEATICSKTHSQLDDACC